MRRRAEVETVFRVSSKVGDGVGPADDRLHLEHSLDGIDLADRGSELADRSGANVLVERDLTNHQHAVLRHLHSKRGRQRARTVGAGVTGVTDVAPQALDSTIRVPRT